MTARTASSRRRWTCAWLLVPAGLLLVAAANAHLVYVAVSSQPECVPHLKEAGTSGSYRAAKSAC
ncbi:hypothetical protein FY036_02040 [Mesorhizobium microcysteis]|uniref:Uncharacterized protein n=1 Tax=Neoaquamicrobium microcysteis TaxID=2682781 RepID=A0A5D4H4Y5_9HYPH|nr:hypothetical protein [Mesorhizobium microcysteis]TYR35667.1 hypothetical protein FY036_02040 [Mesorhizobium microcysteis]